MATLYYSQKVNVPTERGWRVLEDYASAKNHVFSAASAERMERVEESTPGRPAGDYRVVTVAADGSEI